MSIRQSLPVLAFSIALTSLCGTALAADPAIATQARVDQLQSGASESDVVKTLGQPKWVTQWLDGTHSMVYDFNESSGSAAFLFVTFDRDGRLLQSETIENNDGESGGDSSGSASSI